MDTTGLGRKLHALCASGENKAAEIERLLERLSEHQRREVVRFVDEVSESYVYISSLGN